MEGRAAFVVSGVDRHHERAAGEEEEGDVVSALGGVVKGRVSKGVARPDRFLELARASPLLLGYHGLQPALVASPHQRMKPSLHFAQFDGGKKMEI